jgi:hypothetical protein
MPSKPQAYTRLAKLKTRRKLWLDIHLWLGLALGLFLTIFGITGSILVFYAELDELAINCLGTGKPSCLPIFRASL